MGLNTQCQAGSHLQVDCCTQLRQQRWKAAEQGDALMNVTSGSSVI
jgi:hypothetical protein